VIHRTALASIANPVITARNKHIEIKHHFIRDLVSERAALFHYVASKQNLADGLTKALPATSISALQGHDERLGTRGGQVAHRMPQSPPKMLKRMKMSNQLRPRCPRSQDKR